MLQPSMQYKLIELKYLHCCFGISNIFEGLNDVEVTSVFLSI